ncbi:MAG: autotransporter-associated beta strand repeat-containing protein [Prosthecobacter sp.]|nr:autotransporter-associated beta strand repeat-containing protein [Prosthecobacter sp.]
MAAVLLTAPLLHADAPLYTWDGDLNTPGTIENTAGAWNLTDLRWYDGTTYQTWSNSAIAQFGSTSSNVGAAITVDQAFTLAGLNFLPFLGNSLPSANLAYSLTGTGSLNFAPNSVISIATGSSNGSSGIIRMKVPVAGSDLTIFKPEGTALGYISFDVSNPDLTGMLTLKSANAITGGIYAAINHTRFTGLSGLTVESGSVAAVGGGGTITLPITIAGIGVSSWGAIRIESSNSNFAGGILLSADARIHTHINVLNATISSAITETAGGSKSFSRTAYSPVNTTSVLAMTYSGANTYTGDTSFGRVLNVSSTSENSGTEGGLNILDFTSATAPDNDIFYHGTAPGSLSLIGGLATPTGMIVNGAAGETNSQSFVTLNVQQGGTSIEVNSGDAGTANLNLGEISRSDAGTVAIKGPASGSITGTFGGSSDVFLGPWATYTSADGKSSTWAALSGGAIGAFTGDIEQPNGATLEDSLTANVRLSSLSTGDVTLAGETNISTLSMTDQTADRLLDIGAANTLRLAELGGFQIIQSAKSLTVGALGDGSDLTAGGYYNSPGEIILTNLSSESNLTINSDIVNNGSGVISLVLNGTGRTILTGANTLTGMISVHSGVLEIQSDLALGEAGSNITRVLAGASLNLSGDITTSESIRASGQGVALDGAIRNLSGTNTINSLLRVQSATRIASDSGTLILTGITAQISGTALTFSGNGDIDVKGNITATSGILNKEGFGTLTLNGTSTATGATALKNGTMHLNFAADTAPATNILYTGGAGGALSMSNSSMLRLTGKSGATNSQSFTTLTFSNAGNYRISADQNGADSLSLSFTTITRPASTVVRFDLPTTGTIKTTAGANNAILTGTGGVAYATIGLNDWAATTTAVSSVRNIVGLSSISGYTNSTASTLSGNADIAAGVTLTTLAANTAITSLRFNQPQDTTITQDAAGRILTTGGILVTPAVGAHDVVISASTLRAPASAADLVIIQNNTEGVLKLVGKISNNAGAGTAALTKAGPGTLVIEAPSGYVSGENYTGATRILDGTLQLTSGTGASITYPLSYSTTFTLGSGQDSGKLTLGSGSVPIIQYGGLRTDGIGTNNALVGGSTAFSTFLTYVSGTFDFRNGFIGGSGTNENNLNLTISIGTTQLGPANTFSGKANIARSIVEVTTLADVGLPSSLGTGIANSAAAIIDMTTQTTAALDVDATSTLRYIGSTDSVTNRPISLKNTDVIRDIKTITADIENTGTGTIKFTSPFISEGSNTAPRTLRLGGTNTGANEIVSMGDTIGYPSSPGVVLEKFGTGTWLLTGNSLYSGGTIVSEGTLLAHNVDRAGSATGLGYVSVQYGATFGGIGRVAPAANEFIIISGGTLSIGDSTLETLAAGTLELATSGSGMLILDSGTIVTLDIFSRPVYVSTGLEAGVATLQTADMLVVSGYAYLGTDSILRVGNPNQVTDFQAGDQWQLFDWSGLTDTGIGTFAQTELPDLSPGLAWDLSELYTSGTLSVSLVPEPSRAALLMVFGIAFVGRRRRSL